MIEIFILQCLLTDLKHCRERYIPVLEATTIRRCADFAPMKINEFGKEYPLWFIRNWKCQYSDERKKFKDL